jgi:hypothetical protein
MEHARIEKKAKEKDDEGSFENWESEHAGELESTNAHIKEILSTDVLEQARELYLPHQASVKNSKWMPEDDFTQTGPR